MASATGDDQGGGSGPSRAERRRLDASAIFAIVLAEGRHELERPTQSLWWSGFAGGLAISTSLFAEGILHQHLPETAGKPLLVAFGYSVGFILVVIGRLQLFTETTITAALPLFTEPSRRVGLSLLRMWGVVFAANMAGVFFAVAVTVLAGLVPEAQIEAYSAIARPLLDQTFPETLKQAVPAGFLIAALVWMLPNSRGFELFLVIVVTWMVAAGGYSHVVVGGAEMAHLVSIGAADIGVAARFIGAALIGNVIGGTVLFALIAYGQVRKEL